MTRPKPITWMATALYVFATVNAIQFYILSTKPYLDVSRYYAGTERLPFQERVFPVPILKALDHVAASRTFLRSGNGVFTQALFGPFLLSLVSFAVASVFVVLLYRAVSRTRRLSNLVAPVFLVLTVATYVVRPTARLYYPYDMPALAFFAAGLYFIYERKYLPLLLVVLIGTFNRETTLFLIAIYILDAVSGGDAVEAEDRSGVRQLDWRRVPWLGTACLAVVWVGVRVYLGHLYAGNDRSEDHLRLLENLRRFTPQLLPSILNLCGYTLPIVFFYRRRLVSRRLAAWLLVVPVWIALMFFVGVISESRIYGELVPLAAVAAVLLLEEGLGADSREAMNATAIS
jgi:hypothetical protein